MLSSARQPAIARRSLSMLMVGLVLGTLALVGCLFASVALGAADITPLEVWQSLVNFDETSTNHLIIRTVRLPRSLVALLVGASMAIAGATMQGLTCNPLASPSILGVSAGAAFAVVVSTSIWGVNDPMIQASLAMIGGASTAVLVYLFASFAPGGITPLNLTLSGTVFATLISTLTTSLLLLNQQTLEQVRFWLAGSVAGGSMEVLQHVFPILLLGMALSLVLARNLTVLSLGEPIAQGLGQNTAWVKGLGTLTVVLLVGSSVAMAGPIGFIGLVVPHLVRFFAGIDYRWVLPYSALMGGILLIMADILARLVIRPQEVPVGLIMPLLGAPFFIYLIRTKLKR